MMDALSSLTYVDLIGSAGTLIVVTAYLATQLRLLTSSDLNFPLVNLIGSMLICCSLYTHFNLSSVLMEVFWISISLVGIAKGWRHCQS